MKDFKDLVNHPKKILNYSVVACIVLLIAGLVVLLLGATVGGIMVMSLGIFIVVVAVTVFWRCPKCDNNVPLSAYATGKCPYCGEKLS